MQLRVFDFRIFQTSPAGPYLAPRRYDTTIGTLHATVNRVPVYLDMELLRPFDFLRIDPDRGFDG